MSAILLGIDIGSSALKVALVAADDLRPLAGVRLALRTTSGPDGEREQDATLLRRRLRHACALLRRQRPAAWRRIGGVGIAAPIDSQVRVAADGRVRGPVLSWQDPRAAAALPTLAQRQGVPQWRRTSVTGRPQSGLARLALLAAAAQPGERIVALGDLMVFDATGVWRQGPAGAYQNGCWNMQRGGLDAGPLRLAGVAAELLPPLGDPCHAVPLLPAAARHWGLPPGIPVQGPFMDHEALHGLAARVAVRPLSLSLGTAWVGTAVLPAGGSHGSAPVLVIPGTPPRSVRVAPCGGAAWQGLAEASGGHPALERELRTPLPPPDLRLLPPAPRQRTGVLHGVAPDTPPAALRRAWASTMVLALTQRCADLDPDAVVLAGGCAASTALRRLCTAAWHPVPTFVLRGGPFVVACGAVAALAPRARPAAQRLAADSALVQGLAEYGHRLLEHDGTRQPGPRSKR